jgi:hypothetical protein
MVGPSDKEFMVPTLPFPYDHDLKLSKCSKIIEICLLRTPWQLLPISQGRTDVAIPCLGSCSSLADLSAKLQADATVRQTMLRNNITD